MGPSPPVHIVPILMATAGQLITFSDITDYIPMLIDLLLVLVMNIIYPINHLIIHYAFTILIIIIF